MSEFASAPVVEMSQVGDTLQPQTAKVSVKRESPRRKPREPDEEGSEEREEGGRQLDIEA